MQADIVSFAVTKRKQLYHQRVVLINELISCKLRLVQGDNFVVPRIVALKAQLQSLTLGTLEGAKVRSRTKWLDEGEKRSRYFFNLERGRNDRKVCFSILNYDGVEDFTRPEIERARVDFYASLFSPEPTNFACKQHLLSGFS